MLFVKQLLTFFIQGILGFVSYTYDLKTLCPYLVCSLAILIHPNWISGKVPELEQVSSCFQYRDEGIHPGGVPRGQQP